MDNKNPKFESIKILQEKRRTSTSDPDSNYWIRVYDRAIELAILKNSKRKVNSYLVHNLVQDAQKSLKRESEHSIFNNFDSIGEDITDYNFPLISSTTSDEKLIYKALDFHISERCKVIHRDAYPIYKLLKKGYNSKKIAKKLSLSEGQVSKIRKKIQNLVEDISLN
jgi:DNA-binding NarL/FixJ family response regulator